MTAHWSINQEWSDSRLCIDHHVTIEAAPGNGMVVLDGKKQYGWRIFYIGGNAVVELIGLMITGGLATVRRPSS